MYAFVCVCSVEFVPRYIKTSGNATVDHLSKYLAVRLALEELRRNAEASPVNVEAASEKQYTIYIPTAGNQFTVSTHTHAHIVAWVSGIIFCIWTTIHEWSSSAYCPVSLHHRRQFDMSQKEKV